VVDGSNLATEGRTLPSLTQLDEAVRAYAEEDPGAKITVVVDASFEHRIEEGERESLREAMLNGEVVSPPAGAIGRGDAFVLRIAERTGAIVVSNDSFQEFHGQHPWLFDEGRLIGGKPVPGVGWIFTPRLPIRGPKSRAATELARAAKKVAKKSTKRAAKSSAAAPAIAAVPEPPRRVKADRALSSAIHDAVAEALDPKATAKKAGAKKAAAKKTAAKDNAKSAVKASKKKARVEKAGPKEGSAKKTVAKKAAAKKAEATTKASAPAKAVPSKRAAGTKKGTSPTKASKRGGPDAGTKNLAAASTRPPKSRRQTPLPAVNEPLTFINFVAAFPVGSTVEGTVVSFTSHGAMVDVAVPKSDSLHCYIPLSAMGNPPPVKARQVLKKGELRQFTLTSLDASRRVAELALPLPTARKRKAPAKRARASA
jgi:hypothetical protein